jgi:hypothetical protein
MRKLTASVIVGLAIVAAMIWWSESSPTAHATPPAELAVAYPPAHLFADEWERAGATAAVPPADVYPWYGAGTIDPQSLVQPVAASTVATDDMTVANIEADTLEIPPVWVK